MDIVCFQETKIESISNGFMQSLWGCPYVDWCHVDSRGASGDILLMWDHRAVSRIDPSMGRFVVACIFRNVDDGLYGLLQECMVRIVIIFYGGCGRS